MPAMVRKCLLSSAKRGKRRKLASTRTILDSKNSSGACSLLVGRAGWLERGRGDNDSASVDTHGSGIGIGHYAPAWPAAIAESAEWYLEVINGCTCRRRAVEGLR